MEGVGDGMTANNSAELKGKEVNLRAKKREYKIVKESPTVIEHLRSGNGPICSLHRNGDAAGSNDSNRCVMSLTGAGPACTSHCSIGDSNARVAVEELTVGNYRNSRFVLDCGTSSSKLGKCDRLYDLASGPGLETLDRDSNSMPQDMDQMLSKIRQQLSQNPPERGNVEPFASKRDDHSSGAISTYIKAISNKNISNAPALNGAGTKTMPTSSFSDLILKRMLKEKERVNRTAETHSTLDGRYGGCKDRRADTTSRVSFDGIPKFESNKALLISHGISRSVSESPLDGVNLREWLSTRNRKRVKSVSLLLFTQIVQLVDSAHCQGSVFQEMKPSSFMVSSSFKVMYVGLCGKKNQDQNKKRPFERESSPGLRVYKQQKSEMDMQSRSNKHQFASNWGMTVDKMDRNQIYSYDSDCTGLQSASHLSQPNTYFLPRNQSMSKILQLEEQWYACPEEPGGRNCKFRSNMYGLGVLLFELLCSSESMELHCTVMSDLRQRILPPRFLSENPMEAGFCLWLLHPDPCSRPTAREILQSELLYEDDASDLYAANDEESELLLHFLSSLKEQKQKDESKLVQDIHSLEEDIKEAERRYSSSASSVKLQDGDKQSYLEDNTSLADRTHLMPKANEDRLMKNMRQLEDAYFYMKSHLNFKDSTADAPHSDKSSKENLLRDRDKWSKVETKNKDLIVKEKPTDKLEVFFEGLCKFARYSKFEVCGTIRSGDLLNSANVVCSLSFDRDEEYIATAGVSKRIKIFDFSTFMNDSVGVHYPQVEMVNKSKLSCVCWNNYIKNYLASTDYDGVVQMWDAGTGQGFSHYAEHQKRAWSVDFSPFDPTKFASGSDDCTVKLWNINEKKSIGNIKSPANVCCVQFSTSSNHLLSFGSADYKVYCYDLRYAKNPWCTLVGHEKTVSYVKFLDSQTIVSASTDNSIKLWNLKQTSSSGSSASACSQTFRGHTNQKNFVGLSVLDGYIACGSETNEVFSYYRSLPMPITSYNFGSVDPISGHELGDIPGQFVSSVCWRRKSNMLVASNSTGSMKLLKLV